MLFGLWMEAEAMSENTRLYREHPDWALTTDDGRRVGELVLNMADPDAAKYVEDSVIRVIRDFKLDFYKLDYNVRIQEGGQTPRDGFFEHESWRHFEALHRIYDRVRREFPRVVLENCASGGGRNDLGMMSRFHYACESDWSVFPFGIRAINTMTLFLPPEALCYYHNHIEHAHQTADLDTHLRVILFATPIFVGFGAQNANRSTTYFATTRKYIEMAKGFCRPIMANRPAVYHHTPDIGVLGPADWCVLEYAARDRTRGYAGVFRLNGEGGPADYVFRPRGLDASRDYDVTLDNNDQTFRAHGRDLINTGLTITLDNALTSELLLFSAAESAV
jgi:alpha-galactosidase